MGLYVSRVICEKLGGDICAFSDGLDKGTLFEFRIQLENTSFSQFFH